MFRLLKNTINTTNQSESSISVTDYAPQNAEYGEDYTEEHISDAQEKILSRTELKLLDYKHFLAARTIQANWRSLFLRFNTAKRKNAAITIQSWWRRFHAQRNLFSMVENRLQKTVVDYHARAAIKIQALWRGYFVRQTVHDMHSLRRMQLASAEDLLHCVAFKLHHLLRTYSIPGVYSIRNSNCLSKVERLLASMNFRFHNDRVRTQRAKRDATNSGAREKFTNSKYATEVPYSGPNYLGACPPQCEDLFEARDVEKRMYKIIAMYQESMQSDPRAKHITMTLAEKRKRKKIQAILERQSRLQHSFCGDVINSMQKWKILDDKNLTVNEDIFRTPQNVEEFLKEIQSYMNLMQVPCHCNPKNIKEEICH